MLRENFEGKQKNLLFLTKKVEQLEEKVVQIKIRQEISGYKMTFSGRQ